jgi:hypothetical protein
MGYVGKCPNFLEVYSEYVGVKEMMSETVICFIKEKKRNNRGRECGEYLTICRTYMIDI